MSNKLTKENTEHKDESYFIRCSCHGHLLNVTVFEEDLKDPQGPLFLTMYNTDSRYSWASRLREAWKILRFGLGGGSELVLHADDALELGKKMVELSERMINNLKTI